MGKRTAVLAGSLLAAGFALADSADDAVALAERTLAYVGGSVDAKVLSPYAKELASDKRWLARTPPGALRASIEREVRKLRRRILFLHPDLNFDKLLAVQRGLPVGSCEAHMVDQYLGRWSQPGPGLIVLENWKTAPKKKVLLEGKLPCGSVLNPDLHWDGDRILFSFCDHTAKPPADADALKVPSVAGIHDDVAKYKRLMAYRAWFALAHPSNAVHALKDGVEMTDAVRTRLHEAAFERDPDLSDVLKDYRAAERAVAHRRYFIYECAADGSWVKQLTGGPGDKMETPEGRQTVLIEDFDPCYLPGGGFVFTSTRCQSFGRCHWGRYTPAFLLYAADDGGKNVRPYSFGEANEWEPSVMNDGRVMYTRWDYVNRNAIWYQGLWAARPDGTSVSHLYGNYSKTQTVTTEAKAIPGSPLVVATAGAHHYLTGGSIALFDFRKGEDGLDPIVARVTPEVPFLESEGYNAPGCYMGPMPVNDTLFFVAYSDEPLVYPKDHPRMRNHSLMIPGNNAYGIYLIDTLGGRELVYRDPEIGTFNPIPLVKRAKPPVMASHLPPADKAPDWGVCYVENVYECRNPIPKGCVKALRLNRLVNMPACRRDTPAQGPDLDLYKESLGTVPVAADGSAMFRLPAGMPIQLQALDGTGKAVMTMRSFIYSQKGEWQGCTGCHESKKISYAPVMRPANRTVSVPEKEVDLGYAGPFNYVRSVQPIFDRHCLKCHGAGAGEPAKGLRLVGVRGMTELVRRKQVSFAKSYEETPESTCRDYFAAASKLTGRLEGGHGGCALSRDELRTLWLWMDFNVTEWSLRGGYGWNAPESRAIDPAGEEKLRAAADARWNLGALKKDAKGAWVLPFDALVNRGDETKSRVLLAALPEAAGGWGQWAKPFAGKDDPDYAKFLALAKGALVPLKWRDEAGTCGRDDACECRSCWVRRGGYNKPKAAAGRDGGAKGGR